ncbi:MAG: N-acetylmuramoyl-L-alanine amidase [Thermodesulfovibrionales bacterium]|nr:N-acetylmuramoyl-L-alanine amidase [Thermodesulfovibrionales bacterium]
MIHRRQKTEDRKQNVENRNKKISSVFCFFFPALCFLFMLPAIGNSGDLAEVKGLRHWSTSEYIRVVVDLSDSVEFAEGRLSNPERFFFDLKNARLMRGLKTNYTVTDMSLKSVRVGQFKADTVRIVFDLEKSDCAVKTFKLEDPSRIVIDIFRNIPESNKSETAADNNVMHDIVQRRIVIDAGHGGHDPGAVGSGGLFEKDVVLDVALKVRDIIKKEYPLYDVILTRDKDIFIPLNERAAIANKGKADLFVSIHANASPNRYARGIETYLLNWTDDEDALRVAARENAISLNKMRQVQNELGLILASLERETKRDESVKLAGYVQKSLVSSILPQYPKVINLGVKQALFYVLVGAKMPSILAEVSFISNPDEEKLLLDDSYREKLARSIASGIHSYFIAVPLQKVASNGADEKSDFISPVKYIAK